MVVSTGVCRENAYKYAWFFFELLVSVVFHFKSVFFLLYKGGTLKSASGVNEKWK